jgi:hypothetical protein
LRAARCTLLVSSRAICRWWRNDRGLRHIARCARRRSLLYAGPAPALAARFAGGADAIPYLRMISLAIPLSALAWMTSVVTWGYGHSRYQVAIRNLVPPGVFLAGLGAIAVSAAGPPWMLRAFLVAQAAAATVGLVFVMRVAGPELRGVVPPSREPYARVRLREHDVLHGYAE